MTDLEVISYKDGALVVDSRLIAQELGVEHKNFMELVRKYQADVEQEFGGLRFETAVPDKPTGNPPVFVYLTENQATFYMTLSRNTEKVVRLKLTLVKAFFEARDLLKHKDKAYWYKRISVALSDPDNPLKSGYFCIYLEMMRLFNELETRLDYVLLDFDPVTKKYLIPDISIGQTFNKWLRSESDLDAQVRLDLLLNPEPIDFRDGANLKSGYRPPGKHFTEIEKYNHVYPSESHGDNKIQEVNSYPNKYKSIFHHFLEEIWIPERFISYLEKRDKQGTKMLIAKYRNLDEKQKRVLSNTLIGKLMFCLPESKTEEYSKKQTTRSSW